jgi:hypothetical protein|nr:MAG TPA: DNA TOPOISOMERASE I [Caudoviricetes sp.]
MIEQIKVGDKLTVIKVNSLAATSINEITIDSIQDDKAIFAAKRKRYYLTIDNSVLVLKGHKLGITQGSWNNGGTCFLMSGHCNIGGLDRESMIALLKTNINPEFTQWKNIYWFDGISDKGDPIFVPRPVSENYLRYREEAEANNVKAAGEINVGDFIYSYQKGSKFNDLTDMLKCHLSTHKSFSEELELGKIVDIVELGEDEFTALDYNNREGIVKDKGGNTSDDIAEERGDDCLSVFELETVYSLFTLIRTPSGRAITVDAQGHDYMRYTGLLPHYKTSMAADCARVQESLRIEQEKEQKEKQAKEEETVKQQQVEKTRLEQEYSFLTPVADCHDQKTVANNLRTLLKSKFPTTKFSVRKYYYDSYTVEWSDGPSVPQVQEITSLFVDKGFDGMTDSSFSISSPFIKRYGGIGHISTDRNISDERRNEELTLLNAELGKSYKMEDYVNERCERMGTLVHQRIYKKDFSPAPETIPVTKSNATKSLPKPTSGEGLEIIDYSEKSFAVIGNTKPIKETLKQLGGCFNGRLSCGAGWIFAKTKLDSVKQALSIV